MASANFLAQLVAVSKAALEAGALVPLETETVFVRDGPIEFIVRVAATLAKKPENLQPRGGEGPAAAAPSNNPFLPHDPRMFVRDLSRTHMALLNKFAVVPNHFVVVTKEFQRQIDPLNRDDFAAVWQCIRQVPALAFFNGGEDSGASQPHKHLQVVPLPLAPQRPAVPIDHLITGARPADESAFEVPELPFAHACSLLRAPFDDDEVAGDRLAATYSQLMERLRLQGTRKSYNLLLTTRYMLIVPRSKSDCGPVSINSLGFAGTLLVKTPEALEFLRTKGPLSALADVGCPRDVPVKM